MGVSWCGDARTNWCLRFHNQTTTMTEQDRIKEGDVVTVNFNNIQMTLCRAAIVVACPMAAGDSWIFRDNETGYIHYVSEGCTISKNQVNQAKNAT